MAHKLKINIGSQWNIKLKLSIILNFQSVLLNINVPLDFKDYKTINTHFFAIIKLHGKLLIKVKMYFMKQ